MNKPINRIILNVESAMVRWLKKNIVPINTMPKVIKICLLNRIPVIEISPPNIGKYQNVLGYNKLVVKITTRIDVKIAFKRDALSFII